MHRESDEDRRAASSRGERRGAGRILLLAAILVGHFALLLAYFEPAISTPDANGYFAQARRLATEGRSWFKPVSAPQYVGIHWLRTADDRYYSRYPPGLPLLLAAADRVGGPTAALLVNPLLATLTLLGLFLLARAWIGDGWALLVTAAMAVHPVANVRALSGDAHTAVSFLLVWGLVLLVRWERSPCLKRAFLAGLVFGAIPAVRYPEALFGLGAGFFLWGGRRAERSSPWSPLAGLAGAAIPVSALLLRNHLAFGAFWRTGYSLTREQTGFGLDYFTRHAVPYLVNLAGGGAGLFFGLGVAGIAAMTARRSTRRRGVLLALLVTPVTLLYMAYYWAPAGVPQATMRFLLPTFFLYALAAGWLLRELSEGGPRAARAAGAVVLLVFAAWGVPETLAGLGRQERRNDALARITRTLTGRVEPGSVVIADQRIDQHLDFIGLWRLADEAVLRGVPGPRPPAAGRRESDAPSPMQPDRREEVRRRYGGLRGRGLLAKVREDLRAWAGAKAGIYWLIDEGRLGTLRRLLPAGDRLREVRRIDLPRPEERAGGPPGAGRRRPRVPGRAPFPPGGPGGRFPRGPRRGGRQPGPGGVHLVLVEWLPGA